MNKSFTYDNIQFAWDATSISAVQKCLRYYQYKHIEGWHPHHYSDHLRFGAHYATALEHYYKRLALGEDEETALLGVVHEALLDTWDYDVCPDCHGSGQKSISKEEAASRLGTIAANVDWASEDCYRCEATGKLETGKPWASLDNVKNRENLIRTIVWYIEHFKSDPTPVLHLSDGSPAVELSFSLPVDNGIVFAGHIDRLVSYSDDPYAMDQKTTGGTVGPYYFDQFSPHTQMSMYTFAGKMLYGQPIKGVIIDAAQIAVGFTRFERAPTMRTADQLDEWYDNTMFWIAQAQTAVRENYFPMNPASCYNFGGCEFRKVCSRPTALRKQFLLGDFTRGKTWDPLEKR